MEIAAQIQDISKFVHFHCWQEVFVESPNGGEEEACWAVPTPDAGDELTCLVVLKETENLAPRSNVRAAKDPLCPDLRLRPKTDDLRPPEDKKPTSQPKVETVCEDDDDFVTANGEKCVKVPSSGEEPLTSTETSGEPQTAELPNVCNVQDRFDAPVLLPKFSPDELIGAAFLCDAEDGQKV